MNETPVPQFGFWERRKLKSMGIANWVIPTHMTNKELMTLNKLAKKRAPGSVFVEVGSYIGASSLVIAKGLPSNSVLNCVDTWENHAMTEGHRDTFKEFNENTQEVKDKIKTIRGFSVEAAKGFDKKIDFLFLDGDHSYEGAKGDVDAWFPKLNPGATVIMHDIGWAKGVIQVVKENVSPLTQKEGRLPNMYWAIMK